MKMHTPRSRALGFLQEETDQQPLQARSANANVKAEKYHHGSTLTQGC